MKHRVYVYDNVKLIMIMLVVLGHSVEPFIKNYPLLKSTFLYAYTFHMPMFIFVAGLFSKSVVADEKKWRNRIFYYLILYFILKFARSILAVGLGKQFTYHFFWEDGAPWFLFLMAASLLIMRLLKDFSMKYVLAFSIVFACVCGYDSYINDYLVISRIIVYFPFFTLGYMFDYKAVLELVSKRKVAFFAILGLLVFTVFVYLRLDLYAPFRPLITGRNSFGSLKDTMNHGEVMYLFGGFYRLVYYIVVTILLLGIIAITPKGKMPFSFLGEKTLAVYFYHRLALGPIRASGFYPMLNAHFEGIPLLIAHIILSALMVLIFSMPVFSKPFQWVEKLVSKLP